MTPSKPQSSAPVLAQCYYVGLNPRWIEIPDPMAPDNMPENLTGGYSGVFQGGALRVQERMGWGDEPRPQFRILVTLGKETYHAYAHDVAAMLAVMAQWSEALSALAALQR